MCPAKVTRSAGALGGSVCWASNSAWCVWNQTVISPKASDRAKKGETCSQSCQVTRRRCQATQQSKTKGNITVEVLLNNAAMKARKDSTYQSVAGRQAAD